jgi:hypothetical protein
MYNTRLKQKTPSFRKTFAVIVAIIIVVIIFLVFVSVGQVTITVHPANEIKAIDFNAEITGPDETGQNKIPGRVLTTVVSGREKITEVETRETDKPAGGKVVIHNNLEQDQPLIATTRLLSETGVLFRLKKQVNAKANSTVEAEVYADQPGPAGEIGPTKFTIPGLWIDWQDKIYAESTAPMTGGYGETEFISQETLDKGLQETTERLRQQGESKLQGQLKSGEKILADAVKIDILSSQASVKPDTFGAEFFVTAEIRLTAVVFDEDRLYQLAEKKLREQTGDSLDIKNLSRENFSYALEIYDLNKKTATLTTHLEASTTSKLNPDGFNKSKLVGRNYDEIIDYLSREQYIGEVEVRFSPAWLETVPANENRIELIVVTD